MADIETFKQQTFTTEIEHAEGYRRLSRLAVWSIPLGLLSALSMVSPLLWFIPAVAVVFALGGLWVISRSDDTTGRRLALTGLGLAMLFGTWGMTWTISRRIVLNRQARAHATEWLGLMQGQEFMKAHQLSIDYYKRTAPGSSLEAHYAEREPDAATAGEMSPVMEQTPRQEFHDFQNHGVPQRLVAAKGDFEFEYVKSVAVHRAGQFDTKVDQVYHLTFSDDGQPREMDVNIEMKRTVDQRQAYWQVGKLSETDESG